MEIQERVVRHGDTERSGEAWRWFSFKFLVFQVSGVGHEET